MSKHLGELTLILLVTCRLDIVLVCNVAEAQEKDPLPVEDVLRVHSFGGFGWSSIDLSPDGKWVAYVVSDSGKSKSADREATIRTGVPLGTAGEDIYVLNIETGEAKRLTGRNE